MYDREIDAPVGRGERQKVRFKIAQSSHKDRLMRSEPVLHCEPFGRMEICEAPRHGRQRSDPHGWNDSKGLEQGTEEQREENERRTTVLYIKV